MANANAHRVSEIHEPHLRHCIISQLQLAICSTLCARWASYQLIVALSLCVGILGGMHEDGMEIQAHISIPQHPVDLKTLSWQMKRPLVKPLTPANRPGCARLHGASASRRTGQQCPEPNACY